MFIDDTDPDIMDGEIELVADIESRVDTTPWDQRHDVVPSSVDTSLEPMLSIVVILRIYPPIMGTHMKGHHTRPDDRHFFRERDEQFSVGRKWVPSQQASLLGAEREDPANRKDDLYDEECGVWGELLH
ncbi:hypothetical protein ID866_3274 [Astraeus odoratus]|nr:hypothetical protein ID866_3274 [Astraeus odoratus]